MEPISSFVISVLASVAGYYICKWLDSNSLMSLRPFRNCSLPHCLFYVNPIISTGRAKNNSKCL